MTGRRKKKVFLQALFSSLFILLILCGAWYFAKTYKPPTPEEYIERGQVYLEGLQAELGVEGSFQNTIYWDWIDEDGTLLPLTGKQFLLGTVDTNGIGKYGKIKSNNLTKVNNKFFKPIIATTEDYYVTSKFAESAQNSRAEVNDPLNETFRGFEKGQIKCLMRLTPQSDPFGSFFCGTVDTGQMKLQKQFSSIFSTKYNPNKNYSFRVEKIQESFAKGTVSETIFSYTWIAKKTDGKPRSNRGKWSVIWKGEEIPLCLEMEEKSIPKGIYLRCHNGN